MQIKFEEWLASQQTREDEIGYLARVLAVQEIKERSSRRKPDEHRYWVDAVTRIEEPGHVRAFNSAWQEYLEARQINTDEFD
ncbi:MAG: hypothetical protein H6658_05895 [Ardenticatenaceae bacterium]|nr:hypothetical protein [Ardenticatenaceae bacterium]